MPDCTAFFVALQGGTQNVLGGGEGVRACRHRLFFVSLGGTQNALWGVRWGVGLAVEWLL